MTECDCIGCRQDRDRERRRAKAAREIAKAKASPVITGRGPIHMKLELVANGYQQKFVGQMSTELFLHVRQGWQEMYGLRLRSINSKHFGRSFVIRGLFEKSALLDSQRKIWNRLMRGRVESKSEIIAGLPAVPSYEANPETNIIGKFGLELEGGWRQAPRNLRGDGSVNVPDHRMGEVSTTPLSPVDYPWQREFFARYPNTVNRTCGMHIHISFPSLGMHAAFIDNRFPQWLLDGLKEWSVKHHLKSQRLTARLNGRNSYCHLPSQRENWVANQIAGDWDRYTVVNYESWYKFKTMEIRVLPMFNMPKLGRKAIIETLRLVNLWGNTMGPFPQKRVLFEAKELR